MIRRWTINICFFFSVSRICGGESTDFCCVKTDCTTLSAAVGRLTGQTVPVALFGISARDTCKMRDVRAFVRKV